MLNNKTNYRFYKRITSTVILMSFLTAYPMYGKPLVMPSIPSEGNETTLFSELEVKTLIDDLTQAAEEAIKRAAAESAKAATLASLEREANAIAEAQKWNREYMQMKAGRVKNAVMAGLIGFVSGAVLSGVVLISIGGK
jgi:hypothetical protein